MLGKTVSAIILFLFSAACSADQLGGDARPMAVSALSPVDVQSVYHLGAGDKINISVFGEKDVGGDQIVGPDGNIALTLIGPVKAAGRTVGELTTEIRDRLASGYIKKPSVTVSIITFRPFYILGEVNKPGQYEYSKGLTALGAIAKAEGFTYRARKNYIFLKREGAEREVQVDLTPDLQILPGDTLRIGERHF